MRPAPVTRVALLLLGGCHGRAPVAPQVITSRVAAPAAQPSSAPAAAAPDAALTATSPSNAQVRYRLILRWTDCSGMRPDEDCVWGQAELEGSVDGGRQWSSLGTLPSSYGVPARLAVDQQDANGLVVTMRPTGAGVFRYASQDRGATWTKR